MNELNISKIPTIETASKVIETIQGLNLENVSIEDIVKMLEPLLPGYAINCRIPHGGFILYRGVKAKEPVQQYVKDISYPPSESIAKIQRANRPGESLFYASNYRLAPFYELNLKPADKVIISKWVTKDRLVLNNIGYSEEVFSRLGSTRACPTLDQPTKSYDFINQELNRKIKRFFSDEFTKIVTDGNEHLYKISVAIAEKHWGNLNFDPVAQQTDFFNASEFQGIEYPTIAMNANAENVAIKPKYVESHLNIVRVELHEIISRDGMQIEAKIIDTADKFEEGKILWKGRPDQWTIKSGVEVTAKLNEQQEYEVWDKSGNLIPPN